MPPVDSPPDAPAFYGMNDPAGAVRQDGPATTPSTVVWFKAYAVLMLLCGIASFALGVMLFIVPSLGLGARHVGLSEAVVGTFYAGWGTIQAVPCLVSLFARRRPWVWTLDMCLIAFGMILCYCWPLSIPLLIMWNKPEVKAYFGA